MEIRENITNDERILELLELLTKNQMQEKANDVYELCIYMDGLQKQLGQMSQELTGVRQELKEMQEHTLPNQVREQMHIVSNHLREQFYRIEGEVNGVREQIISKTEEILSAAKQSGKKTLNKINEIFVVKDKLVSIRNNVQSSMKDVDNTISKIQEFGLGMREANQQIRATFHNAFGKDGVEKVDKESRFSKTEIAMKPWQARRKLLTSIEQYLTGAIDKVEKLAVEVEKDKGKAEPNQQVAVDKGQENGNQESMAIAMVAEDGIKYGAEEFERAVGQGQQGERFSIDNGEEVKSR